MRMHRALGPAGGARGIEPEGRVVRAGGGRLRGRCLRGDEGLEIHLAHMQRCDRARHDDMADLVIGLDHRRAQRRQQRARHQHGLGPRMLEHVGVVVGGEQGVHRHRHHAGVQRAQEAHGPVQVVEHQQQHAFLAAQAQRTQAGADAAHALVQFAVAQAAVVVDEGRDGGTRRIGLQQVGGEVEALAGCGDGVGKGHVLSPVGRPAGRVRLACLIGKYALLCVSPR